MSDDGYLFYDETPKQCPGCGTADTPAWDGPSYLMILWVQPANSYLCIDCRHNWSTFVSRQAAGCKYPDDSTPLVMKNLELLAKGDTPRYVKD